MISLLPPLHLAIVPESRIIGNLDEDGYLTAHLHRSLASNADFRFVNVALWESAEAFTAATSRPEFRAKTPPFPFHPALYEVVREADRA